MSNQGKPSDLFERLRMGDESAYALLYQKYYHLAAAIIKSNSGNEQDARDIFQETLLVVFKKTREPDFKLTADLGAYLCAIVRKMWLYRLRTSRSNPEILLDKLAQLPDPGVYDLELLFQAETQSEKHLVVKELIKTLKTECQQLIEYDYYYKFSTAEIANLLGYVESFVKVKKHRCMHALREKVKTHPLFKNET